MNPRRLIKVLLALGAPVLSVYLLSLHSAGSGVPSPQVLMLPDNDYTISGNARRSPPFDSVQEIATVGQPSRERPGPCELFTQIVPDQMTLVGDVATRHDCQASSACTWPEEMPEGSVRLGVDPEAVEIGEWDGGTATAEISIDGVSHPTVGILKVSWPRENGLGIWSSLEGQVAAISLDGHRLWAKRTLDQNSSGDYYAAQNGPVMMTFVVTQSITHTFIFSVSAHTVWDISDITIQLCPMPSTIRGLAYSPFRDCQTPHWGDLYPTIEEIREDIPVLFHSANAIRTYSSRSTIGQIPAQAREFGLRVSVGAWLGKEIDEEGDPVPNKNAEEISAAIDIANTVPISSVIVGNEVLLREDLTITQLITYINYVRANIPPTVEVTTAEIWPIWMAKEDHPYSQEQVDELVNAVDHILMHSHPYWAYQPVEAAAFLVISEYKALEREYPEKRIVIGETGWPTGGETNEGAVPTLENQLRFFKEFLYLADREGVEFYFFDPFDELWKRWPSRDEGGEGEAGAHWGLGYADRTAKHALQGVLFPSSILFPYDVFLPLIVRNGETGLMSTFDWPAGPLRSGGDGVIATSAGVTFPVYTEWLAPGNHFVPSGWMGDIDNIGMYECERDNPHGGELSIRASFSPTGARGWAGVYWQDPENNWGESKGGYTLTEASRLSFWLRGETGGEVVEFLVGGLGEPADPYSDTVRPARSSGPIALSNTWQQVDVNLASADLSRVIGGFAWVANRCYNNEPIKFYIDDVAYHSDPGPGPLLEPKHQAFYVYEDDDPGCNRFVPSGWMGDYGDITFDQSWTDDPQSGAAAISITYSADGTSGLGWAGIYWQEPDNNWGDIDGGFDLSWANKLTVWAKGENGAEKIRFFVGGIGIKGDSYPDSVRPPVSTGFIPLADTWQAYTINLRGQDLTRVIGGFGWATDQCANPEGATFHLDNIAFEYDPDLPPPPPMPPPSGSIIPVYTDAAAQDNHFYPTGWMGDGKVPGRVSLSECWTENPHRGLTAIRIAYTETVTGWAGIYWVYPPETWGDRPGGYDLTGADRVTFWARSDTPNAQIEFIVGGIGYPADYQGNADCSNPDEPYPDSVCPKIRQMETLTTTWTEYTVPLPPSSDLSRVVGGFGWVAEDEVVFYLDDIIFEFD